MVRVMASQEKPFCFIPNKGEETMRKNAHNEAWIIYTNPPCSEHEYANFGHSPSNSC